MTRPGQARPDQTREESNLADLIVELAFLLFVYCSFSKAGQSLKAFA